MDEVLNLKCMSRSKKKTPIFTYIGYSNKISKHFCNRKFRKQARMCIAKGKIPPTNLDAVMNEYEFHGDGRRYCKDMPEKYMRK